MADAVLANMTATELKSALSREGDTAWVLASAAMVLLMTPGLAFFYGGLVQETNLVNTMMMSLIAMGFISCIWMLVGFSLAFGDGGPVIGNMDYVFLRNLDGKLWGETNIWSYAFAIFQMTFAIISAAIMSGSLVERVRFRAYCWLITLWSLLVYVPLCHWVWGPGGWLEELGVLDFAGGTVVHVSSGTSGLVASLMLGPRQHKNASEAKPNSVPFVLLGASLLWFGWSGFNGGSALAADSVASRAIATTYLAASASMIVWVFIEAVRMRQPSSVGAMVGAVAGLVVITPAAGFVSPLGAMAMGVLGAPICYGAVVALNRFDRLDDTLDAFGLHGVGGMAGAILTGVFAKEGGLFYGGGGMLLVKQILGSVVGLTYSAAVTAILFGGLKLLMRVRVHQHQENGGLDKHVHGEDAYGWRSAAGLPAGFNMDEANMSEEEEHTSGVSEDGAGSD